MLVVLGGELGEFSVVSVEVMDAGDVGGLLLDSGSRCTFVMVCGWVMMGGGAKVGTGGAVVLCSIDEMDASPRVEGVAGVGAETSKPSVLAKISSDDGSERRTLDRSLSDGRGEAVEVVVMGEKIAWRSSLLNQDLIAPS